METTTILALVTVGSLFVAFMGFLAAQYWNLKRTNSVITKELEDKVDNLQTIATQHESRFKLVMQKIETTENAVVRLETTVEASHTRLEAKIDKMMDLLIQQQRNQS